MKFNTRPDIYIKLQDLRHQLLKLSIRIQLVYVKAHSGIKGNDMADQFSKELAHKILNGDIPAPCTISISDAFRMASDIVTKSWQLHLDNHDKARYTYNLIPSVQNKVIFPTSRETGVSYCRLLLYDSMLRDETIATVPYVFTYGTSDSPLCESCSVNETAEHFLLHCSSYEQARNNMIDYLKDTGVYSELKGRLSESTLLASTCDYDSLSKKDNKILKEALFQFLHQVNRTI